MGEHEPISNKFISLTSDRPFQCRHGGPQPFNIIPLCRYYVPGLHSPSTSSVFNCSLTMQTQRLPPPQLSSWWKWPIRPFESKLCFWCPANNNGGREKKRRKGALSQWQNACLSVAYDLVYSCEWPHRLQMNLSIVQSPFPHPPRALESRQCLAWCEPRR